jgi:hypothetical protein
VSPRLLLLLVVLACLTTTPAGAVLGIGRIAAGAALPHMLA